jgi:hypothetical protein
MDPFVEECRKEWKRLGVSDADANEMAADLEADLREAASEGVAPEEVLGTGVFDPRAFADSWATERGVVPPSPHPHRAPWQSPMLVAAVAFAILAAVGGGLLLGTRGGSVVSAPLAGPPFRPILSGRPPAFFRPPLYGGPQTRCTIPSPTPGEVPAPRCERLWAVPGPIARFVLGPTSRASHRVGWVLFVVGLAGILVLALMWWVVPGPWSRRRSGL